MGVLEEGQTIVSEAWKRDVQRKLDEHFEKLEEHKEKFDRGNERFRETDARMDRIEGKVDTNNEMTERIESKVGDILAIFEAFRGFIRVGGWLGTGLKWLAGCVVAAGIIYWVWKTGDLPKKP